MKKYVVMISKTDVDGNVSVDSFIEDSENDMLVQVLILHDEVLEDLYDDYHLEDYDLNDNYDLLRSFDITTIEKSNIEIHCSTKEIEV